MGNSTYLLINDELLGHVAMIFFSIFVSVSYVLGSLVANDIEPGAITAARFFIGACVMGALVFAVRKRKLEDFKSPWRFFVISFSIIIYFVLMFEALKTSSSLSIALEKSRLYGEAINFAKEHNTIWYAVRVITQK